MHIGSTGPVPVRGARLAVIKLECQKLRRLYRLGLAGSTAVCKITAVEPLVLPASDRRARSKMFAFYILSAVVPAGLSR